MVNPAMNTFTLADEEKETLHEVDGKNEKNGGTGYRQGGVQNINNNNNNNPCTEGVRNW